MSVQADRRQSQVAGGACVRWVKELSPIVTRFEHCVENFPAFLHLAAFMILAKRHL